MPTPTISESTTPSKRLKALHHKQGGGLPLKVFARGINDPVAAQWVTNKSVKKAPRAKPKGHDPAPAAKGTVLTKR